MNRSRPCEVIGHSGADGFYPANTELSFRMALELGVDRIECDLTADTDRRLFLAHDHVFEIDGRQHKVRNLTLEEIRRNDPLVVELDQLLKLTNGKTPLLLDLKPRGLDDDVIVAIAAIRADEDDVSISSTHARSLRKIAQAIPEMRIGLSRGQWATRLRAGRALRLFGWLEGVLQIVPLFVIGKYCHATELMLNFNICVPPLVKAMHAAGFEVYAWTPDRVSDFETLLSRDVDGIITHRPDRLIDTLERLSVPRL